MNTDRVMSECKHCGREIEFCGCGCGNWMTSDGTICPYGEDGDASWWGHHPEEE